MGGAEAELVCRRASRMPLEESMREPIRSGGGCGDPAIPGAAEEELAETPPPELPVSVAV